MRINEKLTAGQKMQYAHIIKVHEHSSLHQQRDLKNNLNSVILRFESMPVFFLKSK